MDRFGPDNFSTLQIKGHYYYYYYLSLFLFIIIIFNIIIIIIMIIIITISILLSSASVSSKFYEDCLAHYIISRSFPRSVDIVAWPLQRRFAYRGKLQKLFNDRGEIRSNLGYSTSFPLNQKKQCRNRVH